MFILIGQDSGSKVIPVSLGTAQPQQEKVVGSSPGQPAVQVEDNLHSFFLRLSIIVRKCSCVISSLVVPAWYHLHTKVCLFTEDLPDRPGCVLLMFMGFMCLFYFSHYSTVISS